ncbi:Rv1733c family protein [Spirillospora sp. CA-142024]|uniref:Rv1733c family protein n=1 Tax=Spirillospora sp. CA-142024 TaxID=3240036 RepID=UPI003D8D01FB
MRRSGIGRGGTPLVRLRRRLGWEHNELRRRVDRVQRLIALGLLLVLLGVAPPLAAWTASWSYSAGKTAEHAERADRHQVVATVTSTGGIGSSGDRYIHETVQASWPGAGGKSRIGTLPSWKNAKVGAHRTIWVDRQGDPTVRPRPHSRTVTDAAYAAGATVLGCALPLLFVYALVRRRCDRHRDDLWEADWARMDSAGHNPRS